MNRALGLGALILAIILWSIKFSIYGDCYLLSHGLSRWAVVLSDTINMVCTLFTMVAVYGMTASWRLPPVLSRLTFPIYVLHEFFIAALLFIWRLIGKKDLVQHSIVMYFVQIFLIVLGCLTAVALLRKFAPKVSVMIFGGR